MADKDRILAEAMKLSEDDRMDVAEMLRLSVPYDPEVDRLWEAEIKRRVEGLRNGTTKTIPHDEAMRMIRAQLGRGPSEPAEEL